MSYGNTTKSFDVSLPLAGEKLAPHQPGTQHKCGVLSGGAKLKELVARGGEIILVDDDWFDELNKFSWRVYGPGYAVTYIKKKYVPMHRIVMAHDLTKGLTVHHRNENKLDNRSSNLVVLSNRWHARVHSKKLHPYTDERYYKQMTPLLIT